VADLKVDAICKVESSEQEEPSGIGAHTLQVLVAEVPAGECEQIALGCWSQNCWTAFLARLPSDLTPG
jgi:hypothetical protein